MGHSDFNGVVEVFGREGNTLHHIHQTTCDKVKNPWGPCTWELEFHKLSDNLLSDPKSPNPLSVSNNIHLGLEVSSAVSTYLLALSIHPSTHLSVHLFILHASIYQSIYPSAPIL